MLNVSLLLSGLEVIKLEFILRFKIKCNDWLLWDTCLPELNNSSTSAFLLLYTSRITVVNVTDTRQMSLSLEFLQRLNIFISGVDSGDTSFKWGGDSGAHIRF